MLDRMYKSLSDALLGFHRGLDFLSPLAFLIMRIWVAWAFLKSGYLKTTNWDSTLYLFEYEYSVPLLPPDIAAYLGTTIELLFPLMLILGLAGRISALVLFVFNIIAVISYPDLDAAAAGDHHAWGIMLLMLGLAGAGKLSLDYWIKLRSATVVEDQQTGMDTLRHLS